MYRSIFGLQYYFFSFFFFSASFHSFLSGNYTLSTTAHVISTRTFFLSASFYCHQITYHFSMSNETTLLTSISTIAFEGATFGIFSCGKKVALGFLCRNACAGAARTGPHLQHDQCLLLAAELLLETLWVTLPSPDEEGKHTNLVLCPQV